MTDGQTLARLAELIERHRGSLLARWRQRVRAFPSAARLNSPTLDDHIPGWLLDTAAQLRAAPDSASAAPAVGAAREHGAQRASEGLDIEEVVAEYGAMRCCIQELAEDHHLLLTGTPLRRLDGAIDAAIGAAIRSHVQERDRCERQQRQSYLSFVTHDLRTPLNAATLALHLLEISAPSSAAGVDLAPLLQTLRRNVDRLADLVGRVADTGIIAPPAADEVPLPAAPDPRRRVFEQWPLVEGVLQEAAVGGGPPLLATRNEVPPSLRVDADASLLASALRTLLRLAQHACAGARLRVQAQAGRDTGPVEVRLLLHRPIASIGHELAPDSIWLPAPGGALPNALQRLVDSHGATLHRAFIDGADTLRLRWSASAPPLAPGVAAHGRDIQSTDAFAASAPTSAPVSDPTTPQSLRPDSDTAS